MQAIASRTGRLRRQHSCLRRFGRWQYLPTSSESARHLLQDFIRSARACLNLAPSGQTPLILPDGRVLIAGGANDSTAEIYNPVGQTFSFTAGTMSFAAQDVIASPLVGGKILIINPDLPAADIFDPTTQTFKATGSPTTARTSAASFAVTLQDGRVLYGGGTKTAEVCDPATGVFTPTGSMSSDRAFASATLLPNGQVLVAGGYTNLYPCYPPCAVNSADFYDPTTEASARLMTQGRGPLAPVSLADNRVLIAGSQGCQLTSKHRSDRRNL
ncbi:MAG: hypothetical protein C5B58_12070 [Acidobacteria bacterium]|nr:MAG: hypothetical protein C5B58_12070 [Acidobacteriota bacterium]